MLFPSSLIFDLATTNNIAVMSLKRADIYILSLNYLFMHESFLKLNVTMNYDS